MLHARFLERHEAEAAVLLRRLIKWHAHVLDLAEREEGGVQHSVGDGVVQPTCRSAAVAALSQRAYGAGGVQCNANAPT